VAVILLAPDDFDTVAPPVARGLEAGGWAVDACPPAEVDDARLRAARALVVGEPRLDDATLLRSVAGELATRARQAGVPCHAVTAENRLDRFAARILDLQAIVEGSTAAELEAAGRALARLI
jgi:glycerate kinase